MRVFRAVRVSFDRQYDYNLYQVDDNRAFYVMASSGSVSVVNYKKAAAPFCYLCGTYETDGSLANLAQFQKGDWIYSQYPEFEGVDAYNLKTGEKKSLDVPPPLSLSEYTDPATVPFYAENGFTFDEKLKLTEEKVKEVYPKLNVMQESCLVINAAFLLLIGLWVIVGIFTGIFKLARRFDRRAS